MQTLTVPATLESLSALRRFLAEKAGGIGRDDQAVYNLQLAVDEIATNAITHGGAGQHEPGTFTLSTEKTSDTLTVTLEDYGEPFDPNTAPYHPPPGGRGIRLALDGVDRFQYQRDGERNRNIFVLSRPRPLVVDLSGEGSTVASRLSELGYEATVIPDDKSPTDPTCHDLVIFCSSPDHPLTADMVKRFKGRSRDAVPALVSTSGFEGAERFLALGADDVLPTSLPMNLLQARLRLWLDKKRMHERSSADGRRLRAAERLANDLKSVILPLGFALSAEKTFDCLLERILLEARVICHADGGTLYLRTADDCLTSAVVCYGTLNLALGGTSGNKIALPPLPMIDPQTGKPNLRNLAVYAANQGSTVNIPESYMGAGFDFSDIRQFDEMHNYRTQSILTVPLKDNTGYVLGVLQLVNARDLELEMSIPFDEHLQELAECFSLQASVAVKNHPRLQRLAELVSPV